MGLFARTNQEIETHARLGKDGRLGPVLKNMLDYIEGRIVDGSRLRVEEEMGRLNSDWVGDLAAQYGVQDWVAKSPHEVI